MATGVDGGFGWGNPSLILFLVLILLVFGMGFWGVDPK